MASVQAVEKLTSKLAVKSYDFDPDATTAVEVGWVDMRNYANFLAVLFRSVGTGTVSSFVIKASASSDGSNSVTVKSHALGSAPDAVGDQVNLECTALEIAAIGSHFRYVSAVIALATSTDECVVTYVRRAGRFAATGLTADIIS